MKRWEYCDNTVVLANADEYYTKLQVDDLVKDVAGMTPQQVQDQIDWSIRTKADKSQVDEIARVVQEQGERLLNTYTKTETESLLQAYLSKIEANAMFANYSKVEGDVLTLNSDNITI